MRNSFFCDKIMGKLDLGGVFRCRSYFWVANFSENCLNYKLKENLVKMEKINYLMLAL